MKLEKTEGIENLQQVFTLTIPRYQLMSAKLYAIDHLLFAECDKSDKVSDKLLALETLAKRIEAIKEEATT